MTSLTNKINKGIANCCHATNKRGAQLAPHIRVFSLDDE